MSGLQLANLTPEPIDSGSNKTLEIYHDVFVDIFTIISINEQLGKVSSVYHAIKTLSLKLEPLLARLNSVNCDLSNKENQDEQILILGKLEQLRETFIRQIMEIDLEKIEPVQQVTYFMKIKEYFQNIKPSDLDHYHHNSDKYAPTVNTSGYLSGLQKDWMVRMVQIDGLMESATTRFEKEKDRKGTSLYSLLFGSSKRLTHTPAIEGPKVKALPPSIENKLQDLKEHEPEPELDSDSDSVKVHHDETSGNFFLPVGDQSKKPRWSRYWNNEFSIPMYSVIENINIRYCLNGIIVSTITYIVINEIKKI